MVNDGGTLAAEGTGNSAGQKVTITAQGTLAFAGDGASSLDIAGILDFASGATIDLGKLNVQGITTNTELVLATAGGITGFDNVNILAPGLIAQGMAWRLELAPAAAIPLSSGDGMARTITDSLVLSLYQTNTLTSTAISGFSYTPAGGGDMARLTLTVTDLLAAQIADAITHLDINLDQMTWEALEQYLTGWDTSIYSQANVDIVDINGDLLNTPAWTGVLALNGYEGEQDGSYFIAYIPEPATGTLSVLALAGLCARRRRK